MDFDKLLKVVGDNTIQAVTNAYSVEKVTKTIEDEIKKNHIQVIYKLIGFHNDWGDWRVDHCNGRSGNSAFGDALKAVAVPKIKEYIESQINTPEFLDILHKNVGRAIQKEIKDSFSGYSLAKMVKDMLTLIIQTELDKCVKESEEALRKHVRERFYDLPDKENT